MGRSRSKPIEPDALVGKEIAGIRAAFWTNRKERELIEVEVAFADGSRANLRSGGDGWILSVTSKPLQEPGDMGVHGELMTEQLSLLGQLRVGGVITEATPTVSDGGTGLTLRAHDGRMALVENRWDDLIVSPLVLA